MTNQAGRKTTDELVCEVAGHTKGKLIVGYGRHMCGRITDGVSLTNGEGECGYVLSFVDLELAYFAAKNFREQNPPTKRGKELAAILKANR